jgi:type IX secretion system PorP/SprF family membrane protein
MNCFCKIVYTLVMLLVYTTVLAQDAQFSQFYAAPLYLNPAFAGSTPDNRVIFQQRVQWPKLDAKYLTSLVSFDKHFDKYNSGVGVMIMRDYQGAGIISSTDVSLQYAYELHLDKNYAFRAGLQLGYVSRYVNYVDLTFPSQFSNQGYIGGNVNRNDFNTDQVGYVDVSSGGLLYSKNAWFSVAAHHMNRPQQSYNQEVNRLPTKFSFAAGYKIPMTRSNGHHKNAEEGFSLTPVLQYKFQGKSDQLDVGIHAFYGQLLLGGWYRGIPIKQYQQGLQNNESVILFTGFKLTKFSLGYSYDFTVSRLAVANTGGSHEVNITVEFPKQKQNKPRQHFPCPKFYEKKG